MHLRGDATENEHARCGRGCHRDPLFCLIPVARVGVLRFGRGQVGVWERAVCLTGGLLRPALPP
jgi:hypothetical protein